MWDVFWFVVGLALIAYAFLWAGLLGWFIFWVGFCLWLGLVELVLKLKTGETLSSRFGRLLREKPRKAYVILALFWLFTLILTWHLISMR